MRRPLIIFLVINLFFISLLLHAFYTLITLLFEDCSADAIRAVDIPAPNSSMIDARPQHIPKIIHQTWKNETIPDKWREPQRTCLELHEDYSYMLWTDEKSRDFIAAEYPWFLDTFDSYPYPIQRADVIRYFVLAHYGGVYIDLDDGCNRRLDPLLSYPAWVRKTIPTGISNDAMGSVPHHPFFLRVIESLKPYARNWYMPYLTVMFSTGPLFLSVVWKDYIRWGVESESARVRVLMPDEYKGKFWSFFLGFSGSSWHQGDANFVFWAAKHWVFLTVLGFLTAAVVFIIGWVCYVKVYLRFTRRGRGKYIPLKKRDTWPVVVVERERRSSMSSEEDYAMDDITRIA
ncbi:hypothetical protein SAICODRAFT_59077 [Saitoella complicata NRRL Y-17804]|uniref:Mannosyl phosphorylinositol ceramide synthase SUR1 n=1 Tax=Saitoella complicata (strain BCRC 22490 / CBS 7301 / JCM 7358 / NBRC 10748 / NRRL Y-17804) TaxID=698492 RepID=A0A0E9NFR6_SAICN|nr:uncharacterized protein SAICODRAFT_59077 [Saitoella complicata NRRL Y-17804]ODQ51951.1 hypothetical protein SAICODRAFT_59077 [Saitoella complicata NRRL Y-17804]GAO48658.1 hypothetical protein G7K_2828-t1 [Saitoella complicata NRRL Y-17804]